MLSNPALRSKTVPVACLERERVRAGEQNWPGVMGNWRRTTRTSRSLGGAMQWMQEGAMVVFVWEEQGKPS